GGPGGRRAVASCARWRGRGGRGRRGRRRVLGRMQEAGGVKWPLKSSHVTRLEAVVIVVSLADDISAACHQQAYPKSVGLGSLQESVDVRACETPVVVEIGDHRFHERFRQQYGAFLVAQVIVENCEGQLLRALTLVRPLKTGFRETLYLVMLGQGLAVSRNHKPVNRAFSLVCFHGARPRLCGA